MLQVRRSEVRVPISLIFFNLPNPSSRTMDLAFAQPIIVMSTKRSFKGKTRPVRQADSLTAVCEPNI
jgi:hypothetical protein